MEKRNFSNIEEFQMINAVDTSPSKRWLITPSSSSSQCEKWLPSKEKRIEKEGKGTLTAGKQEAQQAPLSWETKVNVHSYW